MEGHPRDRGGGAGRRLLRARRRLAGRGPDAGRGGRGPPGPGRLRRLPRRADRRRARRGGGADPRVTARGGVPGRPLRRPVRRSASRRSASGSSSSSAAPARRTTCRSARACAAALDADALERALADVVARHEALRTTFAAEDGHAVQVVRHRDRLAFERLDLPRRGRPRGRGATARRRARRRAARPRTRAADAGAAAAGRRRGARARARLPPHHLRRLVARGHPARAGGALRRAICAARSRRWPPPGSSTPTTPAPSARG